MKYESLYYRTRKNGKGELTSAVGKRVVFVSHRHRDNTGYLEEIINLILEYADCAVWYDLKGLVGGANYDAEIASAIESAEAMVLLVSPTALESEYIWNKEVKRAKEQDIPIIPVLINMLEFTEEIERRLGDNLQCIDYNAVDFRESFYRAIERHIVSADEENRIKRKFANGDFDRRGMLSVEDKYLMGKGYRLGIGTAADKEAAELWLSRVAFMDLAGYEEETKEHVKKAVLELFRIYRPRFYKTKHRDVAFDKIKKLGMKANELGEGYISGFIAAAYWNGWMIKRDSSAAMDWYAMAAEAGDSRSMEQLCRIYTKGQKGVERDIEKAVYWGEQAVGANSSDAMLMLGKLYLSTEPQYGEYHNVDMGLELLNRAAKQNNTRAQINLAQFYKDGTAEIGKDIHKAVEYYTAAAELKHIAAMSELINIYRYGKDDLRHDMSKAVYWCKEAIDSGEEQRWLTLGDIYFSDSSEFSLDQAITYYQEAQLRDLPSADSKLKKAQIKLESIRLAKEAELVFRRNYEEAKKGNVNALFYVAEAFRLGKGTEKDEEKAIRTHTSAANDGYIKSMMFLADYYERKSKADPSQAGMSVYWYEQAGMHCDVNAMNKLYSVYMKGQLVESDVQRALFWKVRIAMSGDVDAMRFLGWAYRFGRHGLKRSASEALHWYRMAAEKGDAEAMMSVAEIYEKGMESLDSDLGLAIEWYKKANKVSPSKSRENIIKKLSTKYEKIRKEKEAAKAAFEAALSGAEKEKVGEMEQLANMYRKGNAYVEKDFDKALYWYEKLYSLGVVYAMIYVGDLYVLGAPGFPSDINKAVEAYKKAARSNEAGYIRLGNLYRDGKGGMPANARLAKKYYVKAARKRNGKDWASVARLYRTGGTGLQSNARKAVRYYDKAISHGNKAAGLEAASMYIYGQDGLKANAGEAIRYLKTAAEVDPAAAYLQMGVIYRDGLLDGKPDLDKAIEFFDKSAEKGQYQARVYLRHIHTAGGDISAESARILDQWCITAADKKEYFAFKKVQNETSALLKKADIEEIEQMAAKGMLHAIIAAGKAYRDGLAGVRDKDGEKAVQFFRKAVDRGYIYSLMSLGKLYKDGAPHLAQDLDKAEQYLTMAKQHGISGASKVLEDVRRMKAEKKC